MTSSIRSRRDIVRYVVWRACLAVFIAVPVSIVGTMWFHGYDMTVMENRRHVLFAAGLTGTIVLLLSPPLSLRLAIACRSLTLLRDEFERLARTDPLTGLLNRRGLEAMSASIPSGPVSALLADLDFFKRINDVHGHEAGDAVLGATGALIGELAAMRPGAVAARYGGEEFAILLPGAGLEEARLWAETLRARVGGRTIPAPEGPLKITVSLGIAASDAFDGDPATLLASADAALYRAKREGRNRVITVDERNCAAA